MGRKEGTVWWYSVRDNNVPGVYCWHLLLPRAIMPHCVDPSICVLWLAGTCQPLNYATAIVLSSVRLLRCALWLNDKSYSKSVLTSGKLFYQYNYFCIGDLSKDYWRTSSLLIEPTVLLREVSWFSLSVLITDISLIVFICTVTYELINDDDDDDMYLLCAIRQAAMFNRVCTDTLAIFFIRLHYNNAIGLSD